MTEMLLLIKNRDVVMLMNCRNKLIVITFFLFVISLLSLGIIRASDLTDQIITIRSASTLHDLKNYNGVNIGATIDTYSNNKRIPLHLAAYRGYPNIVEFLLKTIKLKNIRTK